MNQDEFTKLFLAFIQERPSLCKSKMAKELHFDRVDLSKIVFGIKNIPRKKRGGFCKFMAKENGLK
jgi:hypothetical protein